MQVLEREEEVFLGRDHLAAQHTSPAILEAVDGAVRRLPRHHRGPLLELEVLEGEELATLLAVRTGRRRARPADGGTA